MPRILFIGDPHGDFGLVRKHGPWADAIVLLGDLCCERPLREELGPHADKTWFIPGNHDCDEAAWLMATWGMAERSLHAKVTDICGLRVAGLGGVFRGSVWMPAFGSQPEELRWRTRADYLAATNPRRRWMGGPPCKHWCTIWPEDVEQLLAQGPADILVTHEAPESHRHGFRVLGDLARVMDVRLVVHGHHHHEEGEAVIEGGIRGRQVGLRGAVGPEGLLDGFWWLSS